MRAGRPSASGRSAPTPVPAGLGADARKPLAPEATPVPDRGARRGACHRRGTAAHGGDCLLRGMIIAEMARKTSTTHHARMQLAWPARREDKARLPAGPARTARTARSRIRMAPCTHMSALPRTATTPRRPHGCCPSATSKMRARTDAGTRELGAWEGAGVESLSMMVEIETHFALPCLTLSYSNRT